MSFFDDASLAFLPSGAAGKDGKAYSIKPTDGTGDFTFSRGSNLAATRVGADGLIEKGRENLLLYSNDFSQWSRNVTTLTSNQTGYDGSSDAWLLTKSGANGFVYRGVSQSGIQTISVYAKANTNSWMQIYVVGTSNIRTYFDLGNGTLGAYASNVIDRSIEDVGNGWYRCSVVFSNSTSQVRFFVSDGNNNETGTSGSILIQDAQLEIGLAATDVIETGATTGKAGLLEDEPRFDYSGGATCPSLLLEPQRSNALPNSEYFGTGYTLSNVSLIENDAISPEGLQNATKIYPTSSGNYRNIRYSPLSPATGLYTYSIFAKAGELDHLVLIDYDGSGVGVDFNLSTGVATSSATTPFDFVGMVDYGNGWYRCIATATNPYFYWILSDNGAVSVTANGTDGLYIYGFQAEQGSYPTSYIPNHSGGSVTRGADSYSKTFTTGLSTNAGTMYFEVNLPQGRQDANNIIQLNGPSTVGWKGASSNIPILQLNGSGTISDSGFFNFSEGTHKILFRWTNGLGEIFIDGVKETSTITDSAAPSTFTGITTLGSAYRVFQKQILLFPEALSDADCITLTTL